MRDEFERGKELQAVGKLDEAIVAYRQVINEDPKAFKAWNNLGTTFEEQYDFDQAVECYQKALEIDLTQSILHYNLAHALHRMGREPEAFGHYVMAVDLNPESFAAQFNFGLLLHERKEWRGAEAAFRRTLEIAPDEDRVHHCLAELLFDRRRMDEALPHYERAMERNDADPEYAFSLGKCLRSLGQLEQARLMFERSLELNPDSHITREHLLDVLLLQGLNTKATEFCERHLEKHPLDAVILHRLAAITGVNAPTRASDEYVRNTFDSFAENFDSTLDKLRYQAPQHLVTLAAKCLPTASRRLDILDAGCGTGLCGVLFRPYALRLVGLDLSGEMLRQAEVRDVYDELIQQELTSYLQDCHAAYDLIIASDTLNYFGSLNEVFKAASTALRVDGRLIFTLEHNEGNTDDWSLQPHGRYCHSEAYLHQSLGDSGFRIEAASIQILRLEAGQPVFGWIVAARRPECVAMLQASEDSST